MAPATIFYETINGTPGADTIDGGNAPHLIYGHAGNDMLLSGAFNDYVYGGPGDDWMIASGADNVYNGARGTDLLSYAGRLDDYRITPAATLTGITGIVRDTDAPEGAGSDRISGVESVYFTADDFVYYLDGRNNAVVARDDTASARAGAVTNISLARALANDIDPDGNSLSVDWVSPVSSKGAVVQIIGGQFVYAAGTVFAGLAAGAMTTDTFTYRASDGHGGFDMATITVAVTGVSGGVLHGGLLSAQQVALPLPDHSPAQPDPDVFGWGEGLL